MHYKLTKSYFEGYYFNLLREEFPHVYHELGDLVFTYVKNHVNQEYEVYESTCEACCKTVEDKPLFIPRCEYNAKHALRLKHDACAQDVATALLDGSFCGLWLMLNHADSPLFLQESANHFLQCVTRRVDDMLQQLKPLSTHAALNMHYNQLVQHLHKNSKILRYYYPTVPAKEKKVPMQTEDPDYAIKILKENALFI